MPGPRYWKCLPPSAPREPRCTAAKALLRSARNYDAFCVFDADNEADPAFLSEMNRALDRTAIVKSRILAKKPDTGRDQRLL